MRRSITRRTQDNREALRAELLDQLMTVAERLLDEGEDYMSITVDKLVSEAGVSKSKFYVYFKDKEELLHTAFLRITDELEAVSASWWDLGAEITRDTLHDALTRILSTYRPRLPVLAAAYDAAHFDPAVAADVANLTDRVIARLTAHIKRGQREGWIDPDLLPKETASWIVWMAERGQSQMVRTADDHEFDRIVETCSILLWNGLYAKTGTSAPG